MDRYRVEDVLVHPRSGTRWMITEITVLADGIVWYKFRSDGGRIRDMLPYEFMNWELVM